MHPRRLRGCRRFVCASKPTKSGEYEKHRQAISYPDKAVILLDDEEEPDANQEVETEREEDRRCDGAVIVTTISEEGDRGD